MLCYAFSCCAFSFPSSLASRERERERKEKKRKEKKDGQLFFFFPSWFTLLGLVNCIYAKGPGCRLRRWFASFKEKRRGERERLGVVRGGEKKKWGKKVERMEREKQGQ